MVGRIGCGLRVEVEVHGRGQIAAEAIRRSRGLGVEVGPWVLGLNLKE